MTLLNSTDEALRLIRQAIGNLQVHFETHFEYCGVSPEKAREFAAARTTQYYEALATVELAVPKLVFLPADPSDQRPTL